MRILTANARVLLMVLENPDMTQKQIADELGMRFQHVWRALDRLVKEGVLRKERTNRRTYFYAAPGFAELEDIRRLQACISASSVI
ncbi:MAG: winged helix-turn-helix domain-containing protein [Opitutae bacterium]